MTVIMADTRFAWSVLSVRNDGETFAASRPGQPFVECHERKACRLFFGRGKQGSELQRVCRPQRMSSQQPLRSRSNCLGREYDRGRFVEAQKPLPGCGELLRSQLPEPNTPMKARKA